MKVLWHSVAPWAPTGYGQQTGQAVNRIAAMGHDVALSIYYGHQGSEIRWNGLRCLPSYSANYGTDVLLQHALHHFGAEDDPDLVTAGSRGLIVLLGDAWTFEVPMLNQMAVACWVPVDHLALPDVTRRWFDTVGAVPLAMSRFGEQALQEAGFHPRYVPHAIDTSTYSPGDQAEARAATGVPADAFVVGMVANNVGRDGSRKAFTEQIAAFAELRARHSDAFLVLHTDVDQPLGVRLRAFLERTLPKGSYTFTDQYTYRRGMPSEAVAQIYRSLDVLTNTSYGEGFGIPIIEAQACGVPVIVTDSTSMPELVGSGWKVGYHRVWHDSQGAWTSVPHIGDIADRMEDAYQIRSLGDQWGLMKLEAEVFAKQYDADAIAELHWRPVLADLEGALEDRRRDVAIRRSFARRVTVPERIVEADGYVWLHRGPNTDDWVTTDDHENWLWPIWDRLLPQDGVLLDIGAHVGRWSIRMSPRASKVLAVEADPHTAATLRRHLAMNDVANVEVHELAAWDKRAWLDLEDPNGRLDGGGTRTVLDTGNGHRQVQGQRLDRYAPILRSLKDAGRLDLVKIDVEGADLHVLRGLKGILETWRPAILLECHDLYGYYSRAELEALLAELGYRFEVAASVPSNWQPGQGIVSEVRDADYLECLPQEAGAVTTPREARSGR